MAYKFSNQQQAKAYIQEIGNKYNIAGVNGEQTNANNFHTAILGLLHVVGKDTAAVKQGRSITQEVEDASLDPQFSATPNSISLYDVRGTSTKEITLNYLGDVRTITVSGYKPKGGTLTFDGKTATLSGGNFLFNEGSISHPMTLTLAATNEYRESAINITLTADSETSFEQIEE